MQHFALSQFGTHLTLDFSVFRVPRSVRIQQKRRTEGCCWCCGSLHRVTCCRYWCGSCCHAVCCVCFAVRRRCTGCCSIGGCCCNHFWPLLLLKCWYSVTPLQHLLSACVAYRRLICTAAASLGFRAFISACRKTRGLTWVNCTILTPKEAKIHDGLSHKRYSLGNETQGTNAPKNTENIPCRQLLTRRAV